MIQSQDSHTRTILLVYEPVVAKLRAEITTVPWSPIYLDTLELVGPTIFYRTQMYDAIYRP